MQDLRSRVRLLDDKALGWDWRELDGFAQQQRQKEVGSVEQQIRRNGIF
jgi:hypothetical protein